MNFGREGAKYAGLDALPFMRAINDPVCHANIPEAGPSQNRRLILNVTYPHHSDCQQLYYFADPLDLMHMYHYRCVSRYLYIMSHKADNKKIWRPITSHTM
jgi:hypothetical protein